MKDNNNHSEQRRDFLKKAGLLLGAGVTVTSLSSLIVSCEKDIIVPTVTGPVTVMLSSYPALNDIGGTVKVDSVIDGSNTKAEFILSRASATEFVALEAYCPHANGEFKLPKASDSNKNLVCLSHKAEFSTSFFSDLKKEGLLSANPQNVTTRSLIAYKVDTSKLSSGTIVVTLT